MGWKDGVWGFDTEFMWDYFHACGRYCL